MHFALMVGLRPFVLKAKQSQIRNFEKPAGLKRQAVLDTDELGWVGMKTMI